AFLTGFVIVAIAAVLLCQTTWAARGLAKFWESSAKRNDYWIATWSMIRDHPWLGVGPGNFGRHYLKYMLPRAFEQIKDPHNFVLEIWATSGLFALGALLVTLGMFFRRMWPVLPTPWTIRAAQPPGIGEGGPWMRWEFYLGGMVGLVLGFV